MYQGIATSHLDSLLLSSAKGLSEIGGAQQPEQIQIPPYVETEKYSQFLKESLKTQIQENESGYISILLDKELYTAGDQIKGTVYIDLFQPSVGRDIFIQFKGTQKICQRVASVVDETLFFQKQLNNFQQVGLLPQNEAEEDNGGEPDEMLVKFDDTLSRKSSLRKGTQVRRSSVRSNGNPQIRVQSARSITGFIESTGQRERHNTVMVPASIKSTKAIAITAGLNLIQNKADDVPQRIGSLAESAITSSEISDPQLLFLPKVKLGRGPLIRNQLASRQEQIIMNIQSMGSLAIDDEKYIASLPPAQSNEINYTQIKKYSPPKAVSESTISNQLDFSMTQLIKKPDQVGNETAVTIEPVQQQEHHYPADIDERPFQDAAIHGQSGTLPGEEEEEFGSFLLFKLDERLFKFRGDKMPAGQYELNFTCELPRNAPSSFKFISAHGETFSVSYHIHVYFNDPSPLMIQTVELKVIGLEKRKKPSDSNKLTNQETGGKFTKSVEKMEIKASPIRSLDDTSMYGLQNSNIKMQNTDMELQIYGNEQSKHNHNKAITEADTGLMSDDDTNSTQSSITFSRYPCFICPGTVPIEAQMVKTVYLPDQQIEVNIKLNQLHSNVKQVRISIVLDLEIVSIISGNVVEKIEQELGSEVLSKSDLKRKLEGSNTLVATISLLKIGHRNEQVWHQILEECPDGILVQENLPVTNQLNYLQPNESKLIQAAKRVSRQQKLQPKKLDVPLDIVFQHKDEFGQTWEQSYQYCQLGTSLAEILKAKYYIKLEFSVGSMMKTEIREVVMPVDILAPNTLSHKSDRINNNLINKSLVYPKARLPPSEFQPMLLPGAHYKIAIRNTQHQNLVENTQVHNQSLKKHNQTQKNYNQQENEHDNEHIDQHDDQEQITYTKKPPKAKRQRLQSIM